MDHADYLELVDLVKKQMQECGLSELAEDANYLIEDSEGEGRLPRPQLHFLELLNVLERFLARTEKQFFKSSLARLGEHVGTDKPSGAVVLSTPRETESGEDESIPEPVDLHDVHDFSELRLVIRELVSEIG